MLFLVLLALVHSMFWLYYYVIDAFEVLCYAYYTRGVGGGLCVFREDVWMPAPFCSRQLQP